MIRLRWRSSIHGLGLRFGNAGSALSKGQIILRSGLSGGEQKLWLSERGRLLVALVELIVDDFPLLLELLSDLLSSLEVDFGHVVEQALVLSNESGIGTVRKTGFICNSRIESLLLLDGILRLRLDVVFLNGVVRERVLRFRVVDGLLLSVDLTRHFGSNSLRLGSS